MRELVPASLRPFGQTGRPALVAMAGTADVPTVELFLQSRSGKTSLGQYELSSAALRQAVARVPKAKRRSPVLRVHPDLLLQRDVVLPLAAEQDLMRVVAYEMDRLTPFRADEVFWSCVAGRRDPARSQLHVSLTMIPRARVQPILAALQQAGFVPARIEAKGAKTSCGAIFLGERRPARAWLGSRIDAAALAGCGILAAVAVTLPFILQSAAWTRIDAQIDAMKPRAMEAERLRTRIASGATTTDAIATARSQVGAPLQAIALLTEMLPDDTFLFSLSARQRSLTISGRSAAAVRLIGAMAAHPLIHNPAFTAPVIRDETNGGEMFSIRAELGT